MNKKWLRRGKLLQAVVVAAVSVPCVAYGQTSPSTSTPAASGDTSAVPTTGDLPSQAVPASVNNVPTDDLSRKEHDARIDALRFRSAIPAPTVSDTVLQDFGGWRSTLADAGFGLNGVLSGAFAVNTLHQPQATYGTHRFIGQTPEFDTSNNYLALTYDLGHIGLTGGMATLMGCTAGSTAGTYGHGFRLCQAYIDQELLHNHFDVQVGYIQNSFQYINIYVGGTLSAGTLGPNASVVNEIGASGIGVGAPTVNLTWSEGSFYNKFGVQRSVFNGGTVKEVQVVNPYGTRFSEPGEGVLFNDEVGYRQFSAPGKKYTWVRTGGLVNTTEYTDWGKGRGKQPVGGMYFLADHQFTQVDSAHPRRGFYAGATYEWAPPNVVTYWAYYEGRIYDIGPFRSRPQDQLAFVANMEQASQGYLTTLRAEHYGVQSKIYNLTLSYAYHVAPGVFFSLGLDYSIHPSTYWNPEQGSPLLLRGVLTAYL